MDDQIVTTNGDPGNADLAPVADAVDDGYESPTAEELGVADLETGQPLESASEPDSPTAEPEPSTPEPWNGDPATLPDELKPTHQNMMRGFHSKLGQVAEMRKQAEATIADYTARLEALNKPAQANGDDDGPPQWPGDNATADEYKRAFEQLAQYHAGQTQKQVMAEISKLQEANKSREQQDFEFQYEQRVKRIESMDGYNDDVAQRMVALAQSDPALNGMLYSDVGMEKLFHLARNDVNELTTSRQQAKHKAGAAKAAVARPKTQAKSATPAENYSGSFTDIAKQVFADAGVPFDSPSGLQWED